jgi:hypothetical protein
VGPLDAYRLPLLAPTSKLGLLSCFLFPPASCNSSSCKKPRAANMRSSAVPTILLLASGSLALNVPRQSNSTGYSVKTPPLDTPWTYKVGTDPWPEYPRPILERSQWQSLNGIWTHQNYSSHDAVNSPPTGQQLQNAVLVPSCLESGLSGRCACGIKLDGRLADSRMTRRTRFFHALQLVFDLIHCPV